MKLHEFWILVGMQRAQHSSERLGQIAFNILEENRPEMANAIRGSDMDPFYVSDAMTSFDKRMDRFVTWLSENW
jgi:uncharacterized protein (DUF1786 family)